MSSERVIGQAIERRRKSHGLTQQQLGDLAGCGRLFVHQLEKGKETVRLDKVLDVLSVLGLQLSVVNGNGRVVDRTDASD